MKEELLFYWLTTFGLNLYSKIPHLVHDLVLQAFGYLFYNLYIFLFRNLYLIFQAGSFACINQIYPDKRRYLT